MRRRFSDVPGDDPIDIASGPTVPDPTRCSDALDILRRYAIGLPRQARARLTPDTLARARASGLTPRERLDDDVGHGFLEALGDSVVTGPTPTHVNDFRAIVTDGPSMRPTGPTGAKT